MLRRNIVQVFSDETKVHAIAFAKWLNTEGWQRYVDEDEWICPAENYNVITTSQLYDKFEKSLADTRLKKI